MADRQNSERSPRRIPRLIAAAGLGAGLLAVGVWLDFRQYAGSPLGLNETAYFEIAKGEGLARITQKLAARGIVSRPLWFRVLAYTSGVQRRLKYGEYEIPNTATPRDLLGMFAEGRVRQYPVTVIEGWTFRDMLESLSRHPVLVSALSGKRTEEIMVLLGFPGEAPEGRFFPDTYFVIRGTTDLDVLARAHARMAEVLDREWRDRSNGLPFSTPSEALILASIIERETGLSEERPKVAGVFVRRLAQGMRLQTDPTVIYGMGAAFDGNIRKADLLRDTPYNTYTHSGLPPTPIALPGRPAIHAALHPQQGDQLYFVARGDGSHVFSATLDEHRRAVAQFQKP